MKPEEIKNLKVFGYGIALIIPYFFVMHGLKEMYNPSFGKFCLWLIPSFIALLSILNVAVTKHVLYIVTLIGLVLFDIKFYSEHGMSTGKMIFAAVALVCYLIAALKVSLLKPVYDKWMMVAHAIGLVISAFILTILYIIAFVPAGIVLRLLKKDLLNEKIDRAAKTYWIVKEEKFDKESCLRQF